MPKTQAAWAIHLLVEEDRQNKFLYMYIYNIVYVTYILCGIYTVYYVLYVKYITCCIYI